MDKLCTKINICSKFARQRGKDGLLVGQSGNKTLDNINYERHSVIHLKFFKVKSGSSATHSFRQKSAYLTGVSSTFLWENNIWARKG